MITEVAVAIVWLLWRIAQADLTMNGNCFEAEPDDRVLDDLAEALLSTRNGPCPKPVLSSVDLCDHVSPELLPASWDRLSNQLSVPLPPLQYDACRAWTFPPGLNTVWDLADFLASIRCYGERPRFQSPAEWLDAQIFVRVRSTLIECLAVDKHQVTRSARLFADLGAE